MRYNLVEEETYQRCIGGLGGLEYVDVVLETLLDALSLNPSAFPVTGVSNIRIAKTRLVMAYGTVRPALTLRFSIHEPYTVRLLHLEVSLPEEMEFDPDEER